MKQILEIEELEQRIESFALIPSDGGKFEFSINGKSLYSKLELGRHAEEGEILGLIKKALKE